MSEDYKIEKFIFSTKFNAISIKKNRSMHKSWCSGNGLQSQISTHRGCECDKLNGMRIFHHNVVSA